MKYRNTVILVLVLAALIAFVYYNDQQQASAPLPTPAPQTLVLDLKGEDVTQIAVTTPLSRTVVRRSGDAWQIAEPAVEEADSARLNELASSFARISATRALTDTPANLAPFGLVTGTLTVTLQFKDNHGETLRFGNAAVGGSAYYVQRAGDPKVYLVASPTHADALGLLTNLPKKPTPTPTLPPTDTPAATPAGTPQGPPLPPTETPKP
jgi:hypothetical protein